MMRPTFKELLERARIISMTTLEQTTSAQNQKTLSGKCEDSWSGSLISQGRRALGMTQHQFLFVINKSSTGRFKQSTLSRVERGHKGGSKSAAICRVATGYLRQRGIEFDSVGDMIFVDRSRA